MTTRTLHQIWLGGAPRCGSHVAWSHEWRELHPGWDYHLWSDADAERERFPLYAQHGGCCATHAQRSDLLRLCILRRYGGLYLDTDLEPLGRSLEPLVAGDPDFLCAEHAPGFLNNHLLYSTPWGPTICALVRSLEHARLGPGAGGWTFFGHGLLHLLRPLCPGMTILPHYLVDPLPPGQGHRRDLLPRRALMIHHTTYAWMPADKRAGNLLAHSRRVRVA